jgi:hypothetical protein
MFHLPAIVRELRCSAPVGIYNFRDLPPVVAEGLLIMIQLLPVCRMARELGPEKRKDMILRLANMYREGKLQAPK